MRVTITQIVLDTTLPMAIVDAVHPPSLCFFGSTLNSGGFFLDKCNQQLYMEDAHLPPVGPAARPLAGFCFL